MAVVDRIKSAWNAFRSEETQEKDVGYSTYGVATYGPEPPSRFRPRFANEKSIVSAVYNRIGIDVAAVRLLHSTVDEQDRFSGPIDSQLNTCLNLEPNLDQGPRAFRQDIAMTLFDKGVAAIVPVDTTKDPESNEIYDIYSLRVGEIVEWYPQHVRVRLYNEASGKREEVTLEKRAVAIVENPLYSVMNAPNSTLQRLIRKLTLLDSIDEQSGSGKLDLIIQLPYVIKNEARRNQAEERRKDIEFQLKDSKYGIAYTDGTEKITQLNRPAENNLMGQIEFLTQMLYGQLGITEEVMNGTADEKAMINYFNRTIEPIVDSIIEAMQRSFIGRTKTEQKERILYFNNPFKIVPLSELSEIADKLSRNEVITPNELRGLIGMIPAKDPKADELNNRNMPDKTKIVADDSVA